MSLPRVSIQIPAYNQQSFIQRAVESALMQDYPNLEVVVLDDASTDQTFTILQTIDDPRLKVFRNHKNLGRVKTYHRLLFELVEGVWVTNLDGDDQFTNASFIREAIQAIQLHGPVGFYHAHQTRINQILKHCSSAFRFEDGLVRVNGEDYLAHYHQIKRFSHLSILFHRELAIASQCYTQDSLMTDFVSIMKLCRGQQLLFHAKQAGCWQAQAGSESNRLSDEEEQRKNQQGIEELIQWFSTSASYKDIEYSLRRTVQYFHLQARIIQWPHKQVIPLLWKELRWSADYWIIFGHYVRRCLRALIPFR